MQDSQIDEWVGLYEKFETKFDRTGRHVLLNSAFTKGDYIFLITYAQHESPANAELKFLQLRQAKSIRKMCWW